MSTSSLSNALTIATTGLRAAQAGIAVVTQNVANAQVDGYSRKSVTLSSLVSGDANSGVTTGQLNRSVSAAVLRQARDTSSVAARLSVEDEFLARFEQTFGPPGGDTNIAARLGDLADSFRALSASPDSASAQSRAINAAQQVSTSFNSITATIGSLRQEADGGVASSIVLINQALAQIADLNKQIAIFQSLGQGAPDLEDQRDVQIALVANEIDISTQMGVNGEIYISTKSGRALLDAAFDARSPPLSFVKTPIISAGAQYAPPPSAPGGLSGVKLKGVDITSEITGGRISGYLTLRDTYLPQSQAQLDELAAALIQSFNFQDLQLFQADTLGYPNGLMVQGTGGVGAASAGAASTIAVASASGLAVGMTMKFASHATTYQITGIAGATITFAQIGTDTGLTQAVPESDGVVFGPAIPQFTNQSALVKGQGDVNTPVSLAGLVGAQVGMRLRFAGHDRVYTVTSVGPALNQFSLQPVGGGSGLQASISAGEAISVMPPIPGITGAAGLLRVNPEIVNSPWKVRDGTRVQSPGSLNGDSTLPSRIIDMFENLQSFSANSVFARSTTFEGFAAGIVAFEASRRAATAAALGVQSAMRDSFTLRLQNESGVNVDQELVFMLQIQNAYSASARVITAIKDMMDELLEIAR